MKAPVISLFLAFGAILCGTAREDPMRRQHPAKEAQARIKEATNSLHLAIQRVNKAIKLIADKDKQKATEKAFLDAQGKWKAFVDAEVATYASATPPPDGATSATLDAYNAETWATKARVKDLMNLAEWLKANYN